MNSAFASDYLGIATFLHAMVGELDQDYFSNCLFRRTQIELVSFPGETRRNLTIVDADGLVAHIQTIGFEVTDNEVIRFTEHVSNRVQKKDTVLISGSLPTGFSNERLLDLIREVKSQGANILVDTDLDRIINVGSTPIDFIKPNIEELRAFSQQNAMTSFEEGLKRFEESGVRFTIVTCGSYGAFLFGDKKDPALFSSSKFEKSGLEAIGSGDAFIGVFAAGLSQGWNCSEALRQGTAAGHSNLYHKGPGRIGDTFEKILEKSQVKEVDRRYAIEEIDNILMR